VVYFAVQDPSVQQATRPSGKTQGLSDFNPFAAEQQQFVGQNYGSQVLLSVEIDLCHFYQCFPYLYLFNCVKLAAVQGWVFAMTKSIFARTVEKNR